MHLLIQFLFSPVIRVIISVIYMSYNCHELSCVDEQVSYCVPRQCLSHGIVVILSGHVVNQGKTSHESDCVSGQVFMTKQTSHELNFLVK